MVGIINALVPVWISQSSSEQFSAEILYPPSRARYKGFTVPALPALILKTPWSGWLGICPEPALSVLWVSGYLLWMILKHRGSGQGWGIRSKIRADTGSVAALALSVKRGRLLLTQQV